MSNPYGAVMACCVVFEGYHDAALSNDANSARFLSLFVKRICDALEWICCDVPSDEDFFPCCISTKGRKLLYCVKCRSTYLLNDAVRYVHEILRSCDVAAFIFIYSFFFCCCSVKM